MGEGDGADGGGGVSPEHAAGTEVELAAQPLALPGPAVSVAQLRDAPILLFVFFHKALRAELAELRRLAVTENGYRCDLVVEIRRRFEFLKIVYQYHCAAEDEVIFLALDVHIKNVACTYSLEHKSIDDLFSSIFHCLDVLVEGDASISKSFQELSLLIGTIQTTICHHMQKEEEQVFPLLMKQFSPQEQASLVWQFICSVPILLLEDFLPWMTSFVSPDEQVNVVDCIKEVVPKEKLLQEVVISWLSNNNQPFGFPTRIGGVQSTVQPFNLKDALKVYSSKSFYRDIWHWKKAFSLQAKVGEDPVGGLHLWHGAIRKDLKGIVEELYQIRSSNSFSTLASVIVQIKFLADVLIFYSNALDKIFYPLLNELSDGCLSPSYKKFPDESQIEGLQRLLHYDVKNGVTLSKFVEKLCWELESFVTGIGDHLTFQEMQVFPLISTKCSQEMQKWLLYMSLLTMPLGLLRCVITWFLAHLSEEESKSILKSIKQEDSLVNKSFASLLHEWVRIGYSGKTSVEKFRKDLQEMFKSRSSFHFDQSEENCRSFLLHSEVCKRSNPGLMKPNPGNKASNCVNDSSSSGSHTSEKYDTSYSSGINLHIFFPGTLKIFQNVPIFHNEKGDASSIFNLEPKPVDHIFFFHKALRKDMDFLVFGSAKLAENIGFLADFHQRFHHIRFLYQIHSDAEDEIAFPALEAKGKGQNISHSYSIDHKLEVEHFNKIGFILDEMSKLHISISSVHMGKMDQRMLKYHRLCMKLHDMCKSMHKILCDHVNREESELWPLFRECFSDEEQENIIGSILGRTKAEILQEMIPWLMASLTSEEQHAMMSLWRRATKNTMFEEWLREWWDGMSQHDIAKVVVSKIPHPWIADPLEEVSRYLSKKDTSREEGTLSDNCARFLQEDSVSGNAVLSGNHIADDKEKLINGCQDEHQCSECTKLDSENEKRRSNKIEIINQVNKLGQVLPESQKFSHQEHVLSMSQEDLEAAIRRVSRDSSLDSQKKSHIIQNLLMSRWIVKQQKYHSKIAVLDGGKEISGQCPSYRDPLKLTFGCKHYKRNCKLLAACCNQLYACRLCHDDVADHSMDRKKTTKMMCMKCLVIQPVGSTCSTASCDNLSMAKYYCRICKFFDDEREIYHCPYCNLCRVGKGLGIDYFHCMNCNACMSRSLSVHICREKCLEDNCPICHEFIFTSSAPVKALPCGHLMHSACFQDYTCTHYTCPICSKSLGDMQVYFGMLDALMAEEKIPDEYSGQTQAILCNDCEKRGSAAFHWLYHKCPYCGSYNTRLL